MFENNFWYWLLKGMSDLSTYFMHELLPVHLPIGLAETTVTIVFYAAVFLLLIVGGFMHLQVFATVLGAILLMETGRAVFAIWRWVKTVLPLP